MWFSVTFTHVIVGCQGMGIAFRNTFVGQLTEYHDVKVGARGSTRILLFSHSVVSDSLQPCRLQHARLPCPSPSPRVCPNSCPLNWWCHPTISSSVAPFSSCPQSFPASGSFSVSRLVTSGGQSIGASVSASVLLMNIQGWFPLELTCLISLVSKGNSRVFSRTTSPR